MSSPVPRSERPWRPGAAVLLALLTAKVVMVTSIGVRLGPSSTLAFFWQDIASATIVTLAFALMRPRWVTWAVCAIVVGYIALSAPLTIVLGSPLTWTLIRAARGALSDSVRHHVTTHNVIAIGLVWAAGLMGAWIAGILTRRLRVTASAVMLTACALGLWAASRIDTIGLDRNALTALLPRDHAVGALSIRAASRRSPFPGASQQAGAVDLASYRGAARGMNVMLIVLESTAAQYLRIYGAADDPMPTVTRFATHALIYDRAYAAYPESVKGLYATLCGRMPVFGMPAEAHAALPCASIARSFGTAGYRTALFHSGRFGYLGMADLLRGMGFGHLEDAGAIGGHIESSFGVDESSTVDRLLQWIDAADTPMPFFAAYLPTAGHHPYATARPGPFAGDTDFDRYLNALHEADEALARLIRGLHDRRLDRDTVVMIVGDHGEAFGQHLGNTGHTLFIYDENVHVPWIISIPGRLESGRHVETVTSLVDIPSTLRDLAGLRPESGDEGQGLGRLVDPLALFFTDYSLSRAGLRDACWTYLFESGADRSQLFDSCLDGAQAHDRGAEEPLRVAAYRDRVRTAILGQSGNMVGQE